MVSSRHPLIVKHTARIIVPAVRVTRDIMRVGLVDLVTKDDLDAYADGELSPERTELVAAYLAGHPEAAARVEAIRATTRLLRESGAAALEEPIPSRLAKGARELAAAFTDHKTAAEGEG
jgi:hypothetical protein